MSQAYLRQKKADGAESMLYTVLWLQQIICRQTVAGTSTCITDTAAICIHTVNSQQIVQQFYTWQILICNIPHIIERKCEVNTNLIVAQLFQWSIITFHCHHPSMFACWLSYFPHFRIFQIHDKANRAVQERLEMQESNLIFETHAMTGCMQQHAQGLCWTIMNTSWKSELYLILLWIVMSFFTQRILLTEQSYIVGRWVGG